MIKPPSKQPDQLENHIEIIGLSSDNSRNERRKHPQKRRLVLTLGAARQNNATPMTDTEVIDFFFKTIFDKEDWNIPGIVAARNRVDALARKGAA